MGGKYYRHRAVAAAWDTCLASRERAEKSHQSLDFGGSSTRLLALPLVDFDKLLDDC